MHFTQNIHRFNYAYKKTFRISQGPHTPGYSAVQFVSRYAHQYTIPCTERRIINTVTTPPSFPRPFTVIRIIQVSLNSHIDKRVTGNSCICLLCVFYRHLSHHCNVSCHNVLGHCIRHIHNIIIAKLYRRTRRFANVPIQTRNVSNGHCHQASCLPPPPYGVFTFNHRFTHDTDQVGLAQRSTCV